MESAAVACCCSLGGPIPGSSRRFRISSIVSKVSIRPPPPGFDYKLEVMEDTRSAVKTEHPELIDLVEAGKLVLVQKRRFGPVPSWRTAFAEPESIWIVGTSHISAQSSLDVERVIRAVSPDNVVVELCRSRAGIMYTSAEEPSAMGKSNMFSLTGSKFLGAVGRSLDLGGQTALALRLLLAVYSSKISSGTQQFFGDEFRAARRVSEEIGAQLVLGDRPIEITLERAWNSLKWNERFKLISSLFQGITSPLTVEGSETSATSSTLLEKEEDSSPFKLYEQLSLSYPSLLQPLIHERDTYLSWSLKRSKAVCNGKRVVGVIGKGHMNGVVYALVSDLGDLRFRDLVGSKSNGPNSNEFVRGILVGLVRDTVIGIILFFLFDIFWSTL